MAQDSTRSPLPEFIALWDYNHPDSTERRFREILPAARASGDVDYLAQLLTQIARTEGLQRRFDDAHRTLDEAQTLLSQATPMATVRYMLERGRAFNSAGEKDKAAPLFESAWDTARSHGYDPLAVDAAHMIAIISPAQAAIEWNRRAMAYAEESKDPKANAWLGSLYNNLGWAYHDTGDYEEALVVFKKAEAWREEHGGPAETRIAKWCVARCLRSLGRIDEALAAQRALLAEAEAAGAEQDGFIFEELGECLLALGREEEARPDFARAYALLSKDPWLQASEASRLERMKRLGANGSE